MRVRGQSDVFLESLARRDGKDSFWGQMLSDEQRVDELLKRWAWGPLNLSLYVLAFAIGICSLVVGIRSFLGLVLMGICCVFVVTLTQVYDVMHGRFIEQVDRENWERGRGWGRG